MTSGVRSSKSFVPRLVNTADDGHDETRAWLCTDWLVRVQAPAWLRLIAKHDLADALEKCAPILTAEAARAAQPTLDRAQKEANAAWDAARAAAWDAAWAAAWAAAWDAFRPTVEELKVSALELYERMVTLGEKERAA